MELRALRAILGGRYELGTPLGSGGFGTVYRASDRRAGTEVAVKLVAAGIGSKAAAERLRREGAILRRVISRHVARVYDSGDDESGAWLVMELVDGAPLTIGALGRPLLPHEVLRVARGLLAGLADVHAAGVVHGDVKPSNVLVPRGDSALDGAKLVDFGLARIMSRAEVAASIGDATMREGTVLGSAHYMAPEVLTGGEPTTRSDLYAVGLVLFELLDEGALFPGEDRRAQLRARVSRSPRLRDRVPAPLSDVLARLLARDPAERYADARAAHEAVADLDTAPVWIVRGDGPESGARVSVMPATRSTSSLHGEALPVGEPPLYSSTVAPPRSPSLYSSTVAPPRSPSLSSLATAPPAAGLDSVAGLAAGAASKTRRLTRLPGDGVLALRETLLHLDLPMLDALARRERGHLIGRTARSVALALRLELDAAALILEPLAMQSDVARAIGAAVLTPRARRATRARVDSDREDRWVDSIDAEFAAMLAALAVVLSTVEDASRDVARCARCRPRLGVLGSGPSVESSRLTLRFAETAARVRRGELERHQAREVVASHAPTHRADEAPFHVVVRALAAAAFSEDARAAALGLERARHISAGAGATLLDAVAATALGRVLATRAPRDERVAPALERAGTLLAHSDAPSLEHEAEQLRATVLMESECWGDAIGHLRAARATAHAERAGDHEIVSAAFEVIVALAIGETQAARAVADTLADGRLIAVENRAAALAWIARSLVLVSSLDFEGAEVTLKEAEGRARGLDRQDSEASVIVEVLGTLFDALRGEAVDVDGWAESLKIFAAERAFAGAHWRGLLGAVFGRVPDGERRRRAREVLERIGSVFGESSAPERPSDGSTIAR